MEVVIEGLAERIGLEMIFGLEYGIVFVRLVGVVSFKVLELSCLVY